MGKNLRLKILIMGFLSVLLLLLIIGPKIATIEAANRKGDSLKANVVDSSEQSTKTAIDHEKSLSDVDCEIIYPEVGFQIKYDKYPLTFLYLLVQNEKVNIRKGPSMTEPVLKTVFRSEKLNYIETITKEEKWYHVTWQEQGQPLFGFVNADVVTKRIFQFDKMKEAVLKAEKANDEGQLTYINNYHNLNGYAPLYQGKELDRSGNRRSQSAPGYSNLSDLSEFSYLEDGTLVKVLSSGDQYTKISLVKDDAEFYVPNKYIATPAVIRTIKKAIIIDRANQNEIVFERIDKDWKVISYTLATTGKVGTYHQPTPLGYFYGIEKRERFYFYKDGTTKIQGYAPYVIRFAGGAYIHGVSVNYKYKEDGTRIDPGKIEYSKTLGTMPLSHKCVRNYTSHAKFLYDWYTPGEVIVIVLE